MNFGGKLFVVKLKRGAPWVSTYTRHLKATTTSIYQKPKKLTEPMKRAAKHSLSNNPGKTINLALHDAGRDESSIMYFHANQYAPPSTIEYQGVLVLRVLMGVAFVGTGWTNVQRRQRVFQLNQAFHALREHFRLVGGARDIQNIYVHFLTGFSGTAAHGDRNYTVNFSRVNYPGSGDRIPNTGGTLTLYGNVTVNEVVQYMLHTTQPTTNANAINHLRDWVNNRLSENFTVQRF